jgi:putative transposase
MKTRFIEEQIIKVIKRHEAGAKVDKLWRDLGNSTGRF